MGLNNDQEESLRQSPMHYEECKLERKSPTPWQTDKLCRSLLPVRAGDAKSLSPGSKALPFRFATESRQQVIEDDVCNRQQNLPHIGKHDHDVGHLQEVCCVCELPYLYCGDLALHTRSIRVFQAEHYQSIDIRITKFHFAEVGRRSGSALRNVQAMRIVSCSDSN
jgi:hypothetical protein